MNTSGIYKITNCVNGSFYIGIAKLAKEYSVHPRNVEAIIKRLTWNNI